MVATADAHATDAAVALLAEGGNAIDAAIAAAFVLSVTQPGMCGLDGGGQVLARFADGRMLCLDFREQAPHAASRDMFAALAPDASIMNAIVWRDGWLQGAVDCRREGRAAGI